LRKFEGARIGIVLSHSSPKCEGMNGAPEDFATAGKKQVRSLRSEWKDLRKKAKAKAKALGTYNRRHDEAEAGVGDSWWGLGYAG
jgi:hypothetical protein